LNYFEAVLLYESENMYTMYTNYNFVKRTQISPTYVKEIISVYKLTKINVFIRVRKILINVRENLSLL